MKIEIGRYYRKQGGDYEFEGTCVSVFFKKSGLLRVVLEDKRGLLFIFNPSQLHDVTVKDGFDLEEQLKKPQS